MSIKEEITRHIKRGKAQFEETDEASESDMAGTWELSYQDLERSMIDMLKALMDRVDSMQK